MSLDTLTVHRINVVGLDGKIEMAITNADRYPPPMFRGESGKRSGGNASGIIFYNRLGDEQGALQWDASRNKDGTYSSHNVLAYDTATTGDQLHLDAGEEHNQQSAYIMGQRKVDDQRAIIQHVLAEYRTAKTPDQRAGVNAEVEKLDIVRNRERFFLGYREDEVSKVVLSDGQGHPRLELAVTKAGAASIRFLDKNGRTTSTIPSR